MVIGVAGLALGVAALPVLGVCVQGDWFPLVKILADKFLVFTRCQAFDWWRMVSACTGSFLWRGGVAVTGLA